jgi:DnaJ-class molecular chaperone
MIQKVILEKNLYSILEVDKTASSSEIKKSYYRLSKIYHPDLNKDIDQDKFNELTEAYDILSTELREEYDAKSRFGENYDESQEFLDFEFNNNAKFYDEDKFNQWVSQNQLNIIHYIDDNFNGSIKYERWVSCKECGGDGKDIKSKIKITDENGNVLKMFEGSDGCDFCDGTGKNWKNESCYFCGGKGKVGYTDCKKCNGEKRILGNQKLSNIKFPKNEKAFKIQAMGHTSKFEKGKVGDLWLIKKVKS